MKTADILKNAIKFPTSIIVRGQDLLGIELAKSLLEQGGFVIIVDKGSSEIDQYLPLIDSYQNLLLIDYDGLPSLSEHIRRLDYVFYLNHQYSDFTLKLSTQEFLQTSNYLDSILDLAAKFDAKFLLTTSIKAHQIIMGNKVIDLNFEIKNAEKYSIYSEVEIQRYSESLVKEYNDKVGLNTRVVRLGSLLGRGMEINVDSILIKLIVQGLQGERLIIPGDGLETDYYVHYLDAAYGIIKAQFSPNTKGNIYTLANEEDVSILGLSYKLIELIPNAKEIQFDQDINTLPPLKLYKPAINLKNIGWAPRISFERALSQTVDFIKSKLIEANYNSKALEKQLIPIKNSKKRKGLRETLFDIFFIAKKEDDIELNTSNNTENINSEGALARLIAERKNQERARKGSIIVANNRLREALKQNPELSNIEKIDNFFNNLFFNIKQRFSIIKNLTLKEFSLWVIGITSFIILYFIFISPILNLLNNAFLLKSNLNESVLNYKEGKYNELNITTNKSIDNINNIQSRLLDLEYIFIISGKSNEYNKYQEYLNSLKEAFEGLDNISKSLIPLDNISSGFDLSIISRLDEKLITSSTNNNFSESFNELYKYRSLLSLGVKSIGSNSQYLINEYNVFPSWIIDGYKENIEYIVNNNSNLNKVIEAFDLLPILTGKDKSRNYLVLIQDSQRYNASGGKISGYFIFTVKNSKITDIKTGNINDIQNSDPMLSSRSIKEISLVSKKIVNLSNVVFDDIYYISDQELFYDEFEEIIEAKEMVNIDVGIILSIKALELITGDSNDIVFKQKLFNESNFINTFNSLFNSNSTQENRNTNVLGYASVLFEKNISKLFIDSSVSNSIVNAYNNGYIRLFSNDPLILRFIDSLSNNENTTDYIDIGMNSNYSNMSINSVDEIQITGKINIKADNSTVKEFKIDYISNSISNSYFCSPSNISNLSISETELENYSQAFDLEFSKKICLILLNDSDNQYGISYNTPPFEKVTNSGYNYIFRINSVPSVLINYNLEFIFDSGINNIKPEDNSYIIQTNGFFFKGEFVNSKAFKFIIE